MKMKHENCLSFIKEPVKKQLQKRETIKLKKYKLVKFGYQTC